MYLRDKLYSMTPENTVAELSQLLGTLNPVAIDWLGRRVVTVTGIKGSVQIYEIAEKYLQASPFDYTKNPSIRERLDCYDLGDRVHGLYIQSNTAIENTLFYKYWIPSIEALNEDPTVGLLEGFNFDANRSPLLSFTPEQYRKIDEPRASQTRFLSQNGIYRDVYTVSLETLLRMGHLATAVS
jgi:hypothetical protein